MAASPQVTKKKQSPQRKNCGLFYSHTEGVVTAWVQTKKSPIKWGWRFCKEFHSNEILVSSNDIWVFSLNQWGMTVNPPTIKTCTMPEVELEKYRARYPVYFLLLCFASCRISRPPFFWWFLWNRTLLIYCHPGLSFYVHYCDSHFLFLVMFW